MKIKSFTYSDSKDQPGWVLDTLQLKEGINLFVGASGSGKTRVLNMLFNIGLFATGNRFSAGKWTITFEHGGVEYTWKFEGFVSEEREGHVVSEELLATAPEGTETSLFSRTETDFHFGTKEVPKLGTTSSGIHLLREEDIIKPVHEGFGRIMRRRFWSEDLENAMILQPVPRRTIRKLEKRADLLSIFKLGVTLHVVLYLLDRYFKTEYAMVCDQFKRVFPFVDDIRIRTAGEGLDVPLGADVSVAVIKERGIKKPVQLNEISSGMQKVLLIITDVVTAPPDTLYMIDEYENSLGVNAIDFLPSFLNECGGTRQFIVTTHHPLLINAIPVSEWFIFHRQGLNIKVTHGSEIENRYGRSKQQRFVQLINDPLYTAGVE